VRRPPVGPAFVLASILCAAAAWHALFVARTAFVLDGRATFTLADDAMISMRYARNLAEGEGLRWNPGEAPVEGVSNFLWTLVMAVPHLLGVPERLTSLSVSALGSLILLVRIGVLWRTARVVVPGSGAAAVCAACLAGSSYAMSFWTLRGLEVGLLALLVDAAALLVLSPGTWESARRRAALAALFTAGVLTRTDAVVPFGAIAAWAVAAAPTGRRRALLLWFGCALVAPLAAHTAFRLAYYGDPLPNTYYLKMTGAPSGERLARGAASLAALLSGTLAAAALAAAAGVVAVRRADDDSGGPLAGLLRSRAALLAAVVLSTWTYSVWVGGDAWERYGFANRYVAVGFGAMHVLAGAACSLTLRRRPDAAPPEGAAAPAWGARRLVAGLALAALVATLTDLDRFLRWKGHNCEEAHSHARKARLGALVRRGTDEAARVAFVWAGTAPYFAHRTAVDLLGKSDPVIARMRTVAPVFPGHDKWDVRRSLGELRPDVAAELWRPTEGELALVASWGYRELPNGVRVLADSPHVRPELLSQPLGDTEWLITRR
jgi:hypothetical protein